MKKIIAYYLLMQTVCLLVVNILVINYGYQASKKEQDWITSMQHIPDSAFNLIKLNASLYSFSEDSEMEYVNKDVSLNGKIYHVFKKKIKDNILYIYYLKNNQLSSNLKLLMNAVGAETKLPVKKLVKLTFSDLFDPFLQNSNPEIFIRTNAFIANIELITPLLSGYKNLAYLPPKSLSTSKLLNYCPS